MAGTGRPAAPGLDWARRREQMPYEFVLTESNGAVGIVRINRPQVRNALNPQTIGELVDALEAFDRDDAIRCMILTGDDRAFAAGAGINQIGEAWAGGVANDHKNAPRAALSAAHNAGATA